MLHKLLLLLQLLLLEGGGKGGIPLNLLQPLLLLRLGWQVGKVPGRHALLQLSHSHPQDKSWRLPGTGPGYSGCGGLLAGSTDMRDCLTGAVALTQQR